MFAESAVAPVMSVSPPLMVPLLSRSIKVCVIAAGAVPLRWALPGTKWTLSVKFPMLVTVKLNSTAVCPATTVGLLPASGVIARPETFETVSYGIRNGRVTVRAVRIGRAGLVRDHRAAGRLSDSSTAKRTRDCQSNQHARYHDGAHKCFSVLHSCPHLIWYLGGRARGRIPGWWSELFHSHFVRGSEFAALGEGIGPLVANLCVHRNRRRHALDGAVRLLFFNRGLGRIRLAAVDAVDSLCVTFGVCAAGNKGHPAGNVSHGFVFKRIGVAAVLGRD